MIDRRAMLLAFGGASLADAVARLGEAEARAWLDAPAVVRSGEWHGAVLELAIEHSMDEVTCLGDSDRTYAPGLRSVRLRMRCLADNVTMPTFPLEAVMIDEPMAGGRLRGRFFVTNMDFYGGLGDQPYYDIEAIADGPIEFIEDPRPQPTVTAQAQAGRAITFGDIHGSA